MTEPTLTDTEADEIVLAIIAYTGGCPTGTRGLLQRAVATGLLTTLTED
jgi:hypothetical protein